MQNHVGVVIIQKLIPILLLMILSSAFFFNSAEAKRNSSRSKKSNLEIPNISIGALDYRKLNFSKGVYKKINGPDHCLEGEYRLMRDPQTGRVFIRVSDQIFINHLDQKVINTQDRDCVLSYFNTINANNELESTEIHSCPTPINVSTMRTLKIKFEPDKINYVFIFKDPTKGTSQKTNCELQKQMNSNSISRN